MQKLERVRQELPENRATLSWMKQEVRAAQPFLYKAKSKTDNGAPLLTVIERTAQQSRIRQAIQRVQPMDNGGARVWFEEVGFNQWLAWLDLLNSKGIDVLSCTLSRGAPGMATVRVTLGRT